MTTSDWSATLREALRKTLEELCFVFPDPDAPSNLPLEATAQVAFSGPMVGRLLVSVRGQALAAITADMLGCEAAPTAAEQQDCLAEIANVACGTTLPLLGDPRAVFDVAPPTVQWGAELALAEAPIATAKLGFEGGAAELALFVNGSAR